MKLLHFLLITLVAGAAAKGESHFVFCAPYESLP
jgi:hypothetical protein